MVDLRQSKEFGNYMKSLGWKVERINNINYFIRPFLFGLVSFMKVQRPREVDQKVIRKLARKYRAWMVVVEPREMQHVESRMQNGFKILKSPYLPSKTQVIDLTKSQKQLLSEMHYKTRYNIRRLNPPKANAFRRAEMEIKISTDISEFARFWNDQRYGKFTPFSQVKDVEKIYKAFGGNAKIIAAYEAPKERNPSEALAKGDKNKELISGILMLVHDNRAYYMYAASSSVGKKSFSSTACTWEAIKLAKKLGCREFDFEGIYDERFPAESWKGFSRFKKSFGGKEIEHPASLVRYGLPI